MKDSYWNDKFINKKYIWGIDESESAIAVIKNINNNMTDIDKSISILDIGCGYGRDVNYFDKENLNAIGIDNSEEAINIGKEKWPHLKLLKRDVLNENLLEEKVDIVFCNFFIHLFALDERKIIIKKILDILKTNGVAYFTVSSDEDKDFSAGKTIGFNLVTNSRGVTKFYYNPEVIYDEFKGFDEIEYSVFKEKHYHDYEHEHINYFIMCKKV
ncbi:class I SAM-dependent methyltransferase [Clostridium butyricum]|uniref:class I SAM-dependent methyltransferase n=1 Tax=Clostridium butyricum TaxID=1492 RepID=UPI00374F9806